MREFDTFEANGRPEMFSVPGGIAVVAIAGALMAKDMVGQMLDSAHRKLISFFGMEEAARVADREELGDDTATIEDLLKKNEDIQKIGRARAIRLEIFGTGFLAGALPRGDWKSRAIRGAVTGVAAALVHKVVSELPPEFK